MPSITEMLFAIDAGSRVVGVSSYDHFPPEVDKLPRVGALMDPDVERILSLRPDLVITYGSQTDLRTQLNRAGIPVFQDRHGSIGHITDTMKELGVRLGVSTQAARAVAAFERDLAAIRGRVKRRPRPRTLLVIGREPQSLRAISVSGGYGFLHDLLDLAGGDNVFASVTRESLLVSTEEILAKAPDVILELHYSEPPAPNDRTRASGEAAVAYLAVRNGKVILLFGGELVVPGPRATKTEKMPGAAPGSRAPMVGTYARAMNDGLMRPVQQPAHRFDLPCHSQRQVVHAHADETISLGAVKPRQTATRSRAPRSDARGRTQCWRAAAHRRS